ncbi:MAG TPA: hypothetical protein VLB07_06850 [Woeseiaceae bacterium]|nr:hypothetical protein [Woeseiaceae bacterium]
MKLLLAGLLLLAGAAVQAQETAPPAPAAEEASVQQAELDGEASEREALEPGVPSAVLAADIRREADGERVMDRLDLGRTEITGNQELPKVLYIVPWQKSDPGDLTGKPVNTLLDEVMAPVDRTEFLRQVEYYNDLNGGTTE